MKKIITLALTCAFAFSSVNCTTTYDAYGNPRQSVDPGTAVAGAAAAGVIGYAIADKRKKDNYYYYNQPRPRRGYYDRYGRYHRY